MIGFWSTPHLLLGESVFSIIQRKSASQHYSFLFATQQLFSSFNVVFSKGPAWTANMEVLRSCPSHFWQSSFCILIFLTVIYLFSFFTSLFWLYSAIWCSSNLPRTLSLQDSLTWLFAMPGMIFDQIYFATHLSKVFCLPPLQEKKKVFHEHVDFFHHFIFMLRTTFDM